MVKNDMNQLPVGTRIGGERYEIQGVIGQGGFGITYRGYDLRLEVPVAIKEYFPVGAVSRYHPYSLDVRAINEEEGKTFGDGKQMFLEEARVLAKFADDPNVVGVRDFFEENQTAYIVMQYLEGESLETFQKRFGPLPFDEVYGMLRPVMQSLAKIHDTGLIHRDISPSNLIRLRDGRIKLIDFGTAREVSPDGERSLSVILKPGYAPVEQYQRKGAQGPWSDVYSLSACIYKLISGKTPMNSLSRMVDDDLAVPSSLGAVIGAQAEQVLMRGLAILADRRIQNMRELEYAFEQALVYKSCDGSGNSASDPYKGNSIPVDDDELTIMGPKERVSNLSDFPENSAEIFKKDIMDSPGLPESPQSLNLRNEEKAIAAKQNEGKAIAAKQIKENEIAAKLNKETAKPAKENKEKAIAAKENKEKAIAARKNKDKPKPSKGKTPGKKSGGKRKILLLVAALALLAVVVFTFTRNGNKHDQDVYKHSDGTKTLTIRDEPITADRIKSIDKDKKVREISFYNCVLDDEAVSAMGAMKHIEKVEFSSCYGFSTLSPLSDIETLRTLQLSGEETEESGALPDEKTMFDADFSQVTDLSIYNYKMKSDLSFLESFSGLKDLTLEFISDMTQGGTLPVFPALEKITVVDMDLSGTDISALGQSENLSDLSLSNTGIQSLSFLENNDNLTTVDANDNELTSLDGLGHKPKLAYLDVNNNKLNDLAVVAECPMLTWLSAQNNEITDISPLSSCLLLTKLTLGGNKISDVSPLANCIQLDTLDLSDNNIEDASSIKDCNALEELKISYNRLKDLEFCEKMINLKTFEASANELTSLEGLRNVTLLENVRLADNMIESIEILKKNEHIVSLDLDNNQIYDLSPIGNEADLVAMSVNNNMITDLQALSGCPSLRYVAAAGNQITSLSGLEQCSQLNAADLGENQITDISALEAIVSEEMGLLLQNNQINDISALNGLKDYVYLSLYSNGIQDFSAMANMTNIGSNSILYIDWNDNMTGESLAEIHYQTPKVVDAPLDRQARLKEDFMAAREDKDWAYSYNEPEFLTKEEADAEIAGLRKDARVEFGFEKPDLEEEETESPE